MGVISRTIDKLPACVQMILMALGLAAFVYGIAHEGWIFILKAIFSPEI
jgi:VIT1/CCC1 family predicted Fe2+/Mn2+ transporter